MINQLPKLTVSPVKHNIDILCVLEHIYYNSEPELNYHDTGNGWTFVPIPALGNSANAAVGGVGMLLSPHVL